MRTSFTILIGASIITLVCFGFAPGKKLFVPPGTVQLSDNLYFDQTEISNMSWREFEFWTKTTYGVTSEQYKNTLLDTLVWRQELNYGDPYISSYYRHPAYNEYPLVGITYEQAVEFCKWRTKRVQEVINTGKYDKKMLPKSLNYRLPTKEEWEKAASAGYDEKRLKAINSGKYKGWQLNNMIAYTDRPDTLKVKPNPKAEIVAPVYTYFPNKLGIYNLFGNVAEMVSEKGVSKGGSWKDRRSEATVAKDYPYEAPNAWLGFRCVCEMQW